jgi:GR25 family glycosyltransferase involved in LPS biosynthesis
MRNDSYYIILIYLFIFILCRKNKSKIISNFTSTDLNKNFDYNMKIYWINLERSKDRKTRMNKQFKKFNITNHERIEAVNGKKIKEYKFKMPEKIEKNLNKYKNILGCTLSHLKCVKKAYENNDQICMVMEDDICLETIPKWKHSLTEIISKAPKNWNIIHLSMSNRRLIDNLLNMKQDFIKRNINHYGTIAYIINRKGIEKIYNKYELYNEPNLKLNYNFKNIITAENILYNYVNTYTYTKILFTFINTQSTIHLEDDDGNFKGRRKILDYYKVNSCE